MTFQSIFKNNETNTVRAGWRILLTTVIFAGLTSGIMMGTRTVLGSLQKDSSLQWSLMFVAATLAIYLGRKYIDKKSMTSLGLKWDKYAVFDILSGIINSAIVMAGVYTLMLSTGLIEFNGFTWWGDNVNPNIGFQMAVLPIALAVFYKLSVVAWWEELVFRGYLLQNIRDGLGLKWAVIISSVAFGFGHFFNPEATLLSTLLISLLTPYLIYAYLKTGQLWLPMGLHLGWNFFQASVFGFASSGQKSPSLIAQSPVGPDWLSGGAFGAEGSILILPFVILSVYLIHYSVTKTRKPNQKFFEFMV